MYADPLLFMMDRDFAEIMSTLSLSLSLSQQTDLKYLEEDLLAKLSLRIIVQQTQSRSSPAFAKKNNCLLLSAQSAITHDWLMLKIFLIKTEYNNLDSNYCIRFY